MAIMKEIKAYISATTTLNSTQYKIFIKMKKYCYKSVWNHFTFEPHTDVLKQWLNKKQPQMWMRRITCAVTEQVITIANYTYYKLKIL